MSTVKTGSEILKNGSIAVMKCYNEIKDSYNIVSNVSTISCDSVEQFKSSLKSTFNNFTNLSNKISEKLIECADVLDEKDSSIGSNMTEALAVIEAAIASAAQAKAQAALSSEYVNPYDPDNLPSETLYDSQGVLTFYQNGKLVKETFCPDSLKYSLDLKFLILKLGYDSGYWVREDGVQMLGEDVMYATNIPEWGPGGIEDESRNRSNSTKRRGDKFYGTSGPGRIVGACGTSEQAALGTLTYNGQKVDETYDVYTRWHVDKDHGDNLQEYVKYRDQWFAKDEAHATRNVINNPPLDPSQRYYQTNQSWVNLFGKYTLTREYIPDGVVNWNTDEWKTFDWVSYFQQNNPDRITV